MAAIARRELAMTTLAAQDILDSLDLASYVFSVEPSEGSDWELHVECGIEGGLQVSSIPIDSGQLQASLRDEHLREQLADDWRRRLGVCRRAAAAPPQSMRPGTDLAP